MSNTYSKHALLHQINNKDLIFPSEQMTSILLFINFFLIIVNLLFINYFRSYNTNKMSAIQKNYG